MKERNAISLALVEMEQDLKDLQIRYEQYFAGVEKREPIREREELSRRLRLLSNRRIIQTDLRFRHQSLLARFHSYASHWDRILRLIDEGKYERHLAKLKRPQSDGAPQTRQEGDAAPDATVDRLYQDLVTARQTCNLSGTAPDRQQVAEFLSRQREKIREKFGDREVDFVVVTEDGKPKIKVRAKK